jgi:hypothetical protein
MINMLVVSVIVVRVEAKASELDGKLKFIIRFEGGAALPA